MDGTCFVEKLPLDILYRLFKYLRTEDQLVTLGKVCKRWQRLASHPNLWRDLRDKEKRYYICPPRVYLPPISGGKIWERKYPKLRKTSRISTTSSSSLLSSKGRSLTVLPSASQPLMLPYSGSPIQRSQSEAERALDWRMSPSALPSNPMSFTHSGNSTAVALNHSGGSIPIGLNNSGNSIPIGNFCGNLAPVSLNSSGNAIPIGLNTSGSSIPVGLNISGSSIPIGLNTSGNSIPVGRPRSDEEEEDSNGDSNNDEFPNGPAQKRTIDIDDNIKEEELHQAYEEEDFEDENQVDDEESEEEPEDDNKGEDETTSGEDEKTPKKGKPKKQRFIPMRGLFEQLKEHHFCLASLSTEDLNIVKDMHDSVAHYFEKGRDKKLKFAFSEEKGLGYYFSCDSDGRVKQEGLQLKFNSRGEDFPWNKAGSKHLANATRYHKLMSLIALRCMESVCRASKASLDYFYDLIDPAVNPENIDPLLSSLPPANSKSSKKISLDNLTPNITSSSLIKVENYKDFQDRPKHMCKMHQTSGLITLIPAYQIKGLQIQTASGIWIEAASLAEPNDVIILVGRTLQEIGSEKLFKAGTISVTSSSEWTCLSFQLKADIKSMIDNTQALKNFSKLSSECALSPIKKKVSTFEDELKNLVANPLHEPQTFHPMVNHTKYHKFVSFVSNPIGFWKDSKEYKLFKEERQKVKKARNDANAQGTRLKSGSKHKQAIPYLTTAIQLDANHYSTFYERGWCYANTNELDLAIADYTKVIFLDPKNIAAYNSRGTSYQKQLRYRLAIADYRKAVSFNEGYYRSWHNAGLCHKFLGEIDEAIECFSKAIIAQKGYTLALNGRGRCYIKKKAYDKAIEDFDMCIQLKSNFCPAYYNRGNAFNMKGEYEKGLEDCNKAYKLKKDNAYLFVHRSYSYIHLNQIDKAIEDCNIAIGLTPELPDSYRNRALARFYKKEYDLCISDLLLAIEYTASRFSVLIPEEVSEIYCLLGDVYMIKNMLTKAMEVYLQSIHIYPVNKKAEEKLKLAREKHNNSERLDD